MGPEKRRTVKGLKQFQFLDDKSDVDIPARAHMGTDDQNKHAEGEAGKQHHKDEQNGKYLAKARRGTAFLTGGNASGSKRAEMTPR